MSASRLVFILVSLAARLWADFSRWRYIRYGEEKLRSELHLEREKRLRRAEKARLDARTADPDSLHDDDPYRRD